MMRIYFTFLIALFFFTSCGDNKNTVTPETTNVDSLLVIYPDSVPLLIIQGNRFFDEYLFDEALNNGSKAFRLDSNNIEARFLYANALNNRATRSVSDVELAQRHLKYVVSKQPRNPKALVSLAASFSQLGDFENSFKYLNEALKLDVKYRDAYILKGSNYLALGKRDLAKSSYETAVQQDTKFFEGFMKLGWMYTEDNQHLFALEYYRTAATLEPKSEDAIYGVAYSLQELKKYDEALANYRHLLEVNNNYYLALFNQGYIKQFYQNDVDSAMYFYKNAIELEPEFVKGWHNLGLCHVSKGNKNQALKSFSNALKYNPDFELSRKEAEKLR
jgi:tetratricopeptide (TPR) repeat protein